MSESMPSMTIANVRELYRSDANARSLFDWCASLKRDAVQTTIDRISTVLDLSRGDAVALAKKLQAVGCGEFIVGRRGSQTRFLWNYSRISLGQVASGESVQLEGNVDPVELEDDNDDGPLTIPEAKRRLAATLGINSEKIEIIIKA